MKLSYLFTAAFLISLGIVLFGEAGLYSAYKSSQEKAKLEARIRRLEKENEALQSEIRRIQKDPEYLEQTIRKNLSLVKEDEVILEFQ